MKSLKTSWHNPIDVASLYAKDEYMVFLHSGVSDYGESTQRSILAVHLEDAITTSWDALANQLAINDASYSSNYDDWINCRFGYLGYELKNQLAQYTQLAPAPISFPNMWMGKFRTIFVFDHKTRTTTCYYNDDSDITQFTESNYANISTDSIPQIVNIASNFSRQEYLNIIASTLEMIKAGEFYQANITRKFFGEFSSTPDQFAIFRSLCEHSPAGYSAFIKIGNKAVISASPECFLQITDNGTVITRPIKGSAARGSSSAQDIKIKHILQTSSKDMAENLMIVDLMRNDIAKHCIAGTVQVNELCKLHSYATIHHLISCITGKKRPECSVLDVIKSCFPAGSMTGAPKIRAINWCDEQEKIARGVYSGSIGWISSNNSAHLSVVIRTLLLHEKQFEFQVGGGIVADSTPQNELEETLTKAKAITKTLNIDIENLASI